MGFVILRSTLQNKCILTVRLVWRKIISVRVFSREIWAAMQSNKLAFCLAEACQGL